MSSFLDIVLKDTKLGKREKMENQATLELRKKVDITQSND